MLIFDKYAYFSKLRHLNPILKLVIYMVLMGISFSGNPTFQMGLIILLCPLTCYLAHVAIKTYLAWFGVLLPFIFLSLATILFSYKLTNADVIFSLGLFKGYIVITESSLEVTVSLLLRVLASLASTYFFILTVPYKQMIQLMILVKMPSYFIDIALLMYRFIFIFIDEFVTMRDSLDLKFSFGNFKMLYTATVHLGRQLLSKMMAANRDILETLELRFDEKR